MRALAVAFLAFGCVDAKAENFSPPPAIDTSQFATQGQLPQPCVGIPVVDTLNGAVGSGNCMLSADGSRPTLWQSGQTTTASDGTYSIGWAKPWPSTNYFARAEPINPAGANPFTCNIMTETTQGVTGKCWQNGTTTNTLINITVGNQSANPNSPLSGVTLNVGSRMNTQ